MSEPTVRPQLDFDQEDRVDEVSGGGPDADSRELMRRIATEDAQAMRELLDRYGETLARFIGRLTAWHADREDVLQEVLVNVWLRAGSYRGEGSLEGWLKRLAANRCRNHFRALATWRRKLEQWVCLGEARSETGPAVIYDGLDPDLQRGLEALSPDDRTAIVLFYLEQMPGEEVADVMGVKVATLHVRLHRARNKLKQIMELETGQDCDGR